MVSKYTYMDVPRASGFNRCYSIDHIYVDLDHARPNYENLACKESATTRQFRVSNKAQGVLGFCGGSRNDWHCQLHASFGPDYS